MVHQFSPEKMKQKQFLSPIPTLMDEYHQATFGGVLKRPEKQKVPQATPHLLGQKI